MDDDPKNKCRKCGKVIAEGLVFCVECMSNTKYNPYNELLEVLRPKKRRPQ